MTKQFFQWLLVLQLRKLIEELSKQWSANWPAPVVPQKAIGDFTGGLMAKQTLANLCNSHKLGRGRTRKE